MKFGEHVLEETIAYELHLTKEKELDGLPDGIKEMAAQTTNEKGKNGWIFTLDYPSYVPFMTYALNRALRKKLALAFGIRAFQGNKNDNQQIILAITKLRLQRSLLLGYKSHAHFILEERMAKTPGKVNSFLNELLVKAKPVAYKEFKELESFAKELDGIDHLEKWDGGYYSEKLKQKLFNLDDEQLKPYFKLENVIEGVFIVANKLYDLDFKEINTIDKYHEDVKTYQVTDSKNTLIAIFYADFHPRKGKRGGA